MVTIIRPGKLPETYVHEGQCGKCHCTVRFTRGEGAVERDQRDGDYVWISCPTCGDKITSPLKSGR